MTTGGTDTGSPVWRCRGVPGRARCPGAAGVHEAADLVVLTAHDEVGLIEDLVLLPVAGLGQIVAPADHLPDFHPNRITFLANKFRCYVATGRDLHPICIGAISSRPVAFSTQFPGRAVCTCGPPRFSTGCEVLTLSAAVHAACGCLTGITVIHARICNTVMNIYGLAHMSTAVEVR